MAKRDGIRLRTRAWLRVRPGSRLPLRGDVAHCPAFSAGPIRVVDAGLLGTAHAHGREVHVWTIDGPDEMRALLDLGVDGLLSDRPDLLREVLRERGQWPGPLFVGKSVAALGHMRLPSRRLRGARAWAARASGQPIRSARPLSDGTSASSGAGASTTGRTRCSRRR